MEGASKMDEETDNGISNGRSNNHNNNHNNNNNNNSSSKELIARKLPEGVFNGCCLLAATVILMVTYIVSPLRNTVSVLLMKFFMYHNN